MKIHVRIVLRLHWHRWRLPKHMNNPKLWRRRALSTLHWLQHPPTHDHMKIPWLSPVCPSSLRIKLPNQSRPCHINSFLHDFGHPMVPFSILFNIRYWFEDPRSITYRNVDKLYWMDCWYLEQLQGLRNVLCLICFLLDALNKNNIFSFQPFFFDLQNLAFFSDVNM